MTRMAWQERADIGISDPDVESREDAGSRNKREEIVPRGGDTEG